MSFSHRGCIHSVLLLMVLLFFGCSSIDPKSLQEPGVNDLNVPLEGNSPTITQVGLLTGDFAPESIIQTLDGKTLRVQGFSEQGKPVLLYFHATWCPYCRNEFNALSTIYPAYSNDIAIVAMDIDAKESKEDILAYMKKFPKLDKLHLSVANQNTLARYSIRHTTTKYAIARNGTILYAGSGEMTSGQWIALLDALKDS